MTGENLIRIDNGGDQTRFPVGPGAMRKRTEPQSVSAHSGKPPRVTEKHYGAP
jgi:hypothetical protein